jgi:hypothetical protein
MKKRDTAARNLFIQRVREKGYDIEEDTVIAREGVYVVGEGVHLLVRTSFLHAKRGVYFFGLTRHIFENFAQLPQSVIAFVLSGANKALLFPASWLWQQRNKLSADAKQFKLEVDDDLRLKVLKSAGSPLDLRVFLEQFELLSSKPEWKRQEIGPKPIRAAHADLQGMLIEVGNRRGLQTYCPNKSPRFKSKRLGDLATLDNLPKFPGLNNSIIRQIDVVWVDKSFPVHAFEVELTTGIWSGLVRLAELRRLNTVLHIVTDSDEEGFRRKVAGDIFREILNRCHHASAAEVRDLFETETRLATLRQELSL